MTTLRKFSAVTIVTGKDRCKAVGALEGLRILATDAPALPMQEYTMPAACRCRFKKHVDRRDKDITPSLWRLGAHETCRFDH